MASTVYAAMANAKNTMRQRNENSQAVLRKIPPRTEYFQYKHDGEQGCHRIVTQ